MSEPVVVKDSLVARVRRRLRGRTRRVPTPTVLQMEAVECGAASLSIVLGSHGRFVPLEELRSACGVSRDGSKASNVLRAARRYGLVARGFKREPEALREMALPVIVHWNFNHFLVVEGFGHDIVYLNDPAGGPRTVGVEEFDQSFTGVVLTFERGEEFAPGGERPGLVRPLLRRLSGAQVAVAFVVLVGLALLVPGLAAPSFNKVFIDEVLVRGLDAWVRPLLWLMGATAVLVAVLTWLQQHYLLRLESRLSLVTSSKFLWHVLRLPVDFFTQRYAGEIGTRVGVNDRVARLLSGDLATTALAILTIALYAVLLVQYDVLLSGLVVTTAILNIVALRYVSRRREDLSQRVQQDEGRMLAVAMNGLQTLETLKASGSESDFFARWAGYQAKVMNADQQLRLTTTLLSLVPPLLLALTSALVIGLGGSLVMDGKMTMGALVTFQAVSLAFLTPVNRLVELGGQLQEMRGGMNRLDDVLRAETDPQLAPPDRAPLAAPVSSGVAASTVAPLGASPSRALAASPSPAVAAPAIVKLTGRLELRDVTFGYSRLEAPLLEDFALTLEPGARVALVGGSGCGKSTIARLVCGLYQPWRGAVLFDGRPREAWPREVMVSSFAVVDQDVVLFADTIRDNLTLWGATPAADERLLAAAQDAAILDEILARPGGLSALVAEGGRNFSGGQRQRLELARALVNDPSLIVLDEATSALDPTTEQYIDDSLRRRGATCLIVAHRLSTIRDCDEIIVLDRGQVVQRGTHRAMAATDGPYRTLIQAE